MIGFIYHELFAKHLEGYAHVESPERYLAVVDKMKRSSRVPHISFREAEPAKREWIEAVHDKSYVDSILSLRIHRPVVLDWGDTVATSATVEAALHSAGAGVQAVRLVLDGECSSVFSAGRPPGHHAEKNRAMGFCIFNNVAIASAYLLEECGLSRVAVVDWDVHHGNGTESIFLGDDRLLYISLHQYPHYPGSGHARITGTGRGEGYNLNIPLESGAGEERYLEEFDRQVLPALDRFKPEFLLISAGFDGHRDDLLSGMRLTGDSFGRMTARLKEAAEKNCGGRIVSLLEGGYNLEALADSVEKHLEVLAGAGG
ncbi:MAG: histone deacetylase [Candidatus Krumholzibacteriota bacterium]|nr:histone deacetylase [Candidatus Krumholzibacteriota bacterium]